MENLFIALAIFLVTSMVATMIGAYIRSTVIPSTAKRRNARINRNGRRSVSRETRYSRR